MEHWGKMGENFLIFNFNQLGILSSFSIVILIASSKLLENLLFFFLKSIITRTLITRIQESNSSDVLKFR